MVVQLIWQHISAICYVQEMQLVDDS